MPAGTVTVPSGISSPHPAPSGREDLPALVGRDLAIAAQPLERRRRGIEPVEAAVDGQRTAAVRPLGVLAEDAFGSLVAPEPLGVEVVERRRVGVVGLEHRERCPDELAIGLGDGGLGRLDVGPLAGDEGQGLG